MLDPREQDPLQMVLNQVRALEEEALEAEIVDDLEPLEEPLEDDA